MSEIDMSDAGEGKGQGRDGGGGGGSGGTAAAPASRLEARLAARLDARLLLAPRPGLANDRLLLDDATLGAALDGVRPLTAGERDALAGSPLTTRRLRQLALARRAQRAPAAASAASSVTAWQASHGMLRAAASGAGAEPLALRTDDGCWTLHLLPLDGGWRAILQLGPDAPFAAALLAPASGQRARVRVLDGAGATILHGALDLDGECEAAWPHAQAPAAWLQAHGAAFSVAPA